jgi:hypothetical protein
MQLVITTNKQKNNSQKSLISQYKNTIMTSEINKKGDHITHFKY